MLHLFHLGCKLLTSIRLFTLLPMVGWVITTYNSQTPSQCVRLAEM